MVNHQLKAEVKERFAWINKQMHIDLMKQVWKANKLKTKFALKTSIVSQNAIFDN
jgi:hypothetical protein